MDVQSIFKFIGEQKTAFIGSVDGDGFPNVKAMYAPRVIEGKEMYFSTNTSSVRVAQFRQNERACVYFYKRGRFKYEGVQLVGRMEVLEDGESKRKIWRTGDSLFYKKGVTDPDYCVLRFTAERGRYYCNFKNFDFEL